MQLFNNFVFVSRIEWRKRKQETEKLLSREKIISK